MIRRGRNHFQGVDVNAFFHFSFFLSDDEKTMLACSYVEKNFLVHSIKHCHYFNKSDQMYLSFGMNVLKSNLHRHSSSFIAIHRHINSHSMFIFFSYFYRRFWIYITMGTHHLKNLIKRF